MKYVALDIGCIECGEPSSILGIFDKKEDAEKVCEKYERIQEEHWHGQHCFEVQEVNKLNEEVNTEYYDEYKEGNDDLLIQ